MLPLLALLLLALPLPLLALLLLVLVLILLLLLVQPLRLPPLSLRARPAPELHFFLHSCFSPPFMLLFYVKFNNFPLQYTINKGFVEAPLFLQFS
ncbi:hypothetical protein DWX31_17045 [Hungatella hathewayi]|uniref:Uncharacterized protein n=1 Tax=Hungatella hathewayi TaxID=154046 RepID=A0A3E3DJY4_9FIRM|nr:hypothetical protein DWX31_17045 [Hungatella hathewayi]